MILCLIWYLALLLLFFILLPLSIFLFGIFYSSSFFIGILLL